MCIHTSTVHYVRSRSSFCIQVGFNYCIFFFFDNLWYIYRTHPSPHFCPLYSFFRNDIMARRVKLHLTKCHFPRSIPFPIHKTGLATRFGLTQVKRKGKEKLLLLLWPLYARRYQEGKEEKRKKTAPSPPPKPLQEANLQSFRCGIHQARFLPI